MCDDTERIAHMAPTTKDLHLITPEILSARAHTIYDLVYRCEFLRALKVIRVTLYNLLNATPIDLTHVQVNRYAAMLNSATIHANRGDAHMIMDYMFQIQQDIHYQTAEPRLRFEDLPSIVKRSIAFAL